VNWLIVKNDLKRNKAVNLTLLLFMLFSAGLAVLSLITASQTIRAIEEFHRAAQPPHFLQMHKGEIDQQRIDDFMAAYSGVAAWQTVPMIDVYGDNLQVRGGEETFSLADCRLDIGLVRQNEARDLLLDSAHRKVAVKKGEIGMPVLLRDQYGLELGDQVILETDSITRTFVIREFILDSQMNSSLVSSTRILLSDEDFAFLADRVGEREYLIEAYLQDAKAAPDFKTAYENAGLPQNGQAVTYAIIFLLSAFTDMVTVFLLLLVSLLLLLVAFLCVRFTLLAALEEEISEIGTLKAIGFPFADIRSLYLLKYRFLALTGIIAGSLLAWMASSVITGHISTTFGGTRTYPAAVALSLAAAGLIFLFITLYCQKLLGRIRKLTVVDAMVSGAGWGNGSGRVMDRLFFSRRLSANWLLGIGEISCYFRSWLMIFCVMIIAVLVILIPFNLRHTFAAPDFITYMGSSLEDILIEVENGQSLAAGYARTKQLLAEDAAIETYSEVRTVRLQAADADNRRLNIDIDCGAGAGEGLKYLSGTAPAGKGEIALSYLNAAETGKGTGDTLTLFIDQKPLDFVIAGVYQDVTSGGYTAKSEYDFPGSRAKKFTFSVDLKDTAEAAATAAAWSARLGAGISAVPMPEFIDQTLGGVVRQLKRIVLAAVAVGSGLTLLITFLFLKLRLAKDFSQIAVLKAVGFSSRDIKRQYLIKMGTVAAGGLLAGILLSNLLGEKIVSAALVGAGIGIKEIELVVNPYLTFLACPLFLLALLLLVTWFVARAVDRYDIMSIINE